MFAVRFLLTVLTAVFLAVAVAGCDSSTDTDSSMSDWLPLYGDGTNIKSEVLAEVGDIEITSRELEMYIASIPNAASRGFDGPDGERLALKSMVETALYVLGAVEMELYNDPDVASTLIGYRREALRTAMVNYGLLRDRKPSDDELYEYFMEFKSRYRQLAEIRARHIQLDDKETAEAVYATLLEGGYGNDFVSMVVEHSTHEGTRAESGELGRFNPGGLTPHVPMSESFTEKCAELEEGLDPPMHHAGRWHIVEILDHTPERPATFSESRNRVESDMLPGYQDGLLKDYLEAARERHGVTLKGRLAPGNGLTPKQLMLQAMNATDPTKAIALYSVIVSDFPEAKEADDALFFAATRALEGYMDPRMAARYLAALLEDYPDSELVEDARYMLDNLGNPNLMNPSGFDGGEQDK